MKEEVQVQKKKWIRPGTKKAESRTLWIVFFYNLLFAAFIIPGIPLDKDHFIEMTNMVVFGYFGVNLLIPCLFVFWRRFTKWYLPILLTAAGLLGQSIGVSVMFLFTGFPLIYQSIILLHLFIFVLWVCAMVTIKVFKLIVEFIIKHNLS